MIPTAKEFLMKEELVTDINEQRAWLSNVKRYMIEFTKLHVEAALKQAAHESQCYNKAKFPGDQNWVVDIDSILNSYPLENIK